MKYITTQITDWYTTSGNIGGKVPINYDFESIITQAKKGITCRNEAGTNKWIPAFACKLVTEPTPEPEPVEVPLIMIRYSEDGGATWKGKYNSDWDIYRVADS